MSWLEAVVAVTITLIVCLTALIAWLGYVKFTYEDDKS
jgi:hypothetical protein